MSGIQQGLLASYPGVSGGLLTGILAYWKLDGNSTDSAGSDNGTDTNVTYTSGGNNGKINQGANFVGTGGINLSTISSLTNNFSFSFWMNSTNVSAFQGLFAKGSFTSNPSGAFWVATGIPGGQVTFSVFVGGTEYRLSSTSGVSNSTWYHVVCTYDGTTMKLYLNAGTPVTRSASGSINVLTDLVSIGKMSKYSDNTSTLYYTGAIDEVGVWSRVITASEVTQLYNSGSGLQYPF